MRRPTADISSPVRASFSASGPSMTQWRAWSSSSPSATLSSAAWTARDLGQHVDAVAVLLDHPLDAAHLALDAPQALDELVLGRGVAARLVAVEAMCRIIPPRGVYPRATPPRGLDWRACSLLPRWRRASRTVSSTPWPAPTPACSSLRSRSTCPRRLCRGLAWHGVLSAPWPGVTRRRACAWHVCGSGLSGMLSTRGGDAVRIALARRDLRGATWPALAGTLCAEGSFETVFGLTRRARRRPARSRHAARAAAGRSSARSPSRRSSLPVLAARSGRGRGLAARGRPRPRRPRQPRRWASRVLPWQVASRACCGSARRRASCSRSACPLAPAVVFAACAAQGSGGVVPLPGAGPATIAAALLVALPAAAGHPVDPAAVAALAVVWPAALTAVGVTLSTVLLAALSGARTPRGLLRAARSLRARPAPAPAAP